MSIAQCMGGWCLARGKCAHYRAQATDGLRPAERLCAPGHDDPEPLKPDTRFGALVAGANADQVAQWRAASVEAEKQLPPPLRGGALEVF